LGEDFIQIVKGEIACFLRIPFICVCLGFLAMENGLPFLS